MEVTSILRSVTFWGFVISLVSRIFVYLGYAELDNQAASDLAEFLATQLPLLIGFVGDGIVLFGRIRTQRKLEKAKEIVVAAKTETVVAQAQAAVAEEKVEAAKEEVLDIRKRIAQLKGDII